MTLPLSGPISMSQVNTELGLPSTTIITLNDPAVRALAGIPAGTISMSDLYGKSASGSIPDVTGSSTVEVADSLGGWDTVGWSSDNNILDGLDGTTANATIDNPNSGNPKQTNYLVARGFGLTVPAGKTLTNLKLDIRIRAQHTGDPAGSVRVDEVHLFNNTTRIGTQYAIATNIDSGGLLTLTIQGNSAFWGVTLTDALVNGGLFGAGIVVRNFSSKGNYIVRYAWIKMSVSW